MKLQDVLGQLGVVYNVIFSFFGSFLTAIYHSIMKEKVINKLFDITLDDLEQIKNEENIKMNIILNLPQQGKLEFEMKDQPSNLNILEQSSNEILSFRDKLTKGTNRF